MKTVDKFGIARLLDPANEQFTGQQRVNAEIFAAVEILGRKLERSEAERDRLTRRLALIESAATVDERTGKLYLPVVMDGTASASKIERTTPKWVVSAALMSSVIALFSLSLVLSHEPQPALTQEQLALLNTLKSPQLSLAAPANNAWKRPENAQLPGIAQLAAEEQATETSSLVAAADTAILPTQTVTSAEAVTPAEETNTASAAADDKPIAAPEIKNDAPVKRRIASAEQIPQDLPPDPALPAKVAELESRAYHGIPEAQHDLATLYASGKLVAQNYSRAIYWFNKSADGGVANANYNLGVIYQRGLGVKQDMPKALVWYEKAAELGHPEAMYNLGIAHIEGIGTKTDIEKGVSYFKRAAKNGVTQAAYNLGVLYESNFIGPIDTSKSLEWYQVAANAGHAEARTAVARLGGAADQALTMADSVEPAAGETRVAGVPQLKNDMLVKVQQELIRQGLLSDKADGIMTPKTEDAIRASQKALGLKEDGQTSQELLNKLQESASAQN